MSVGNGNLIENFICINIHRENFSLSSENGHFLQFGQEAQAAQQSVDFGNMDTTVPTSSSGGTSMGYTFTLDKSAKYVFAYASCSGSNGATVYLYDSHAAIVPSGTTLNIGEVYTLGAQPINGSSFDYWMTYNPHNSNQIVTVSPGVNVHILNYVTGTVGSMPNSVLNPGYLMQMSMHLDTNQAPTVNVSTPTQNGAFHTERRAA